jgi:hypothetical protein
MSPPIPVSPYLFYQSLAFDDRIISYGILFKNSLRAMKSDAWSGTLADPARSGSISRGSP